MIGNEKDGPIRGSGNFLKDAGYANPDEMRVKFSLANNIALVIEDRGITQTDAAKLTGLKQSDVSRIVNGIVKDVSVFRLMTVLASLGKDISIGISEAASDHGVIITSDREPEHELAHAPAL